MVANELIVLTWTEKGTKHFKSMKKSGMLATFQGLAVGFSDNNEISLKMVEIIPEAEELYINWDSTADVNQLYYTLKDGRKSSIPIIYHHKIVWAILRAYCD